MNSIMKTKEQKRGDMFGDTMVNPNYDGRIFCFSKYYPQ